jgi:hypothetical protein
VNLGAAWYSTTTSSGAKTGPYMVQSSGFDSVGTTHTITYASFGPNNGYCDNFGGVMFIIGKNSSGSAGKIGTLTISVSKRAGVATYIQTINNNTVGLTTFSVSLSSNDIVVTSDSDMAITWTFIAGA